MAIAIVHETGIFQGASSLTVVATISATGTGNLIAVTFYLENAAAGTGAVVTGIIDNAGNVYSQVPSAQGTYTATNGLTTDIWYAKNSVAGATLLTATLNTPVINAIMFVHEYSGANKTSPVDTAGHTSQSANMVGPALTITNAGDVLLSINHPLTTNQTAVSSPWAETAPSIVLGACIEAAILIPGATGSYQSTFTPGDAGCISSAAFLPAAAITASTSSFFLVF